MATDLGTPTRFRPGTGGVCRGPSSIYHTPHKLGANQFILMRNSPEIPAVHRRSPFRWAINSISHNYSIIFHGMRSGKYRSKLSLDSPLCYISGTHYIRRENISRNIVALAVMNCLRKYFYLASMGFWTNCWNWGISRMLFDNIARCSFGWIHERYFFLCKLG